jgi:predicted Zn-ribbon and HTH transcriptional regulator
MFYLLAGVILFFVLRMMFRSQCPQCKKYWCRDFKGSYVKNEYTRPETVTRYDIHRDRDGKETGRTERKEQILFQYTDYLNYYTCKKCGHEWTTTSTTKEEL